MRHGGDLGEAERLYPGGPRPWIDLSTGINPVPYPFSPLPPGAFARLPAPGDLRALEAVAAAAYGSPDPATIRAVPGTEIAIHLLPRLLAAKRVVVVGPTYGSHEGAWAAGGHRVASAQALSDADAEVIVVVNPNNPDGRSYGAAELARIASARAARGGLLVVDEAFIDLTGQESLIPRRPEGAVVLRSFGKAYGHAGIRLGFVCGPADLLAELDRMLGSWPVSGPAIAVGKEALSDHAWKSRAARNRAADAERLDALLEPWAEAPILGTSLFRLLHTTHAAMLHDRLAARGIWTRSFSGNPNWLRLGLPRDEAEWRRLEEALQSLSSEGQCARGAAENRAAPR